MVSLGSNKSSSSSASGGFNKLPSEIQGTFKGLASGVTNQLLQPNSGQAFTPLATTADENNAFSLMRQGFTPTADSFASDMAMLQNPYQQSVIDTINRDAGGQFSILNDALNQSGQLGSNRTILGANDVDLTRRNQIGSFLTDQFNTNAGYALNQLPQLRQQDAANLLGIGDFQRAQDTQGKQAGISALMAAAQAMGVLPTAEGSSKSSGSSSGWNFGILSQSRS